MTADVALLSTAHDVADARLHRLTGALSAAGLRVRLEGLGDAADGPADAEVTTVPRPAPVRRLLRAWRRALAVREPVVLVVDPELTVPALVARRLRGTRVVADVHEDYVALLEDRDWATGTLGAGARLIARAAVRAAARADVTLVADDHVPPLSARRRIVVPNRPRLSELPAPALPVPAPPPPSEGATAAAAPPTTARAVYVGDVRASRGIHTMLEAVAAAPGWELDVIGPVAPSERPAIEAAAAASGPRVRLHGRRAPADSWAIAGGADVGLALLADTPAYRAAIPTKVYEYLAGGMAVIVSDLPRVAALVDASGAGVVAGSPAQVAARLRRWLDRPDELAAHRRAARSWAERELGAASPFDAAAAAVADLTTQNRSQGGSSHPAQR